ncbi:hypothetical protein BKK79_36575 (plasmid) [Cupriavidus sp. USMAA2-4]|uniref:hypothetical protein n=1 Tax=Cupriavidus sp. USMAA2-4 TaxID=876364 RepID=UPI0008A6953B|nr:hypothetical protein [Cupriavidus sp. USMAA2-4]AOY97466.1 hypothetical protein BKK79_36575 [Cupriavidus sp. USMAA2-4]
MSYDAEIAITSRVTVQVGRGYMLVHRWIESEQASQPYTVRPRALSHVPALLEDIRQAKDDARRRRR